MGTIIEDGFLINLNSANATSLNSTYNSNVVFNTNGILKDDPNICYSTISLLNAQIPVSFYAVNYANNVLYYTISSITYQITIPVGNYNSNTLITQLETVFLGNSHTFTITLNNQTGILTFVNSTSDFTFLSSTSGTTCYNVLGTGNSTLSSSSMTLTMPYPMNVLGQTKLKIYSKALPTKNYDYGNGNVLATIPVNVPSYSLITWENSSNHTNILNTRMINQIDISIYDQDNNLINFNNLNWNLTIRLSVFRNITFSSNSLDDVIFKSNNVENELLTE
jgi:hypothetical protein